MTAMPEAKLAREAQICYTLAALVSDYDCWRPQRRLDKQTLMREIIGNMKRASRNSLTLLDRVLRGKNELVCEDCGCRKSLELAILTDKKMETAAERRKTAVLFE
jgi:5'-methylthioadenosine phosphorylase